MIDTKAILARNDILPTVERDLGPARRQSGHRHYWLCPFHADHHPSLQANVSKGLVSCFRCGFHENAIGWTMRYHKLAFRDACQRLGGADAPGLAASDRPARPDAFVLEPNAPPSRAWQEAALALEKWASETLHSPAGERALAWLTEARCLKPETIRYWQLGYVPTDLRPNPVKWGLGRDVRLWIPRGIVIPCVVGGVVWGLHVRRPDGKPKYIHVAGSKGALWGADTLPGRRAVALAEGEFDGMVLWQQARDIVGVGTPTTGAGTTWHSDWTLPLFDAETILVTYDTDGAGREGASKKLAPVSARMVLCPPPEGNDVSDFHIAGGNVYRWLAAARWQALPNGPHILRARIATLNGKADPSLLADLKADLDEALNGR